MISDDIESKLMIDWMKEDYNIDVEKIGNLYVVFTKERKLIFFSSDLNVLHKGLIALANLRRKERKHYAKIQKRKKRFYHKQMGCEDNQEGTRRNQSFKKGN